MCSSDDVGEAAAAKAVRAKAARDRKAMVQARKDSIVARKAAAKAARRTADLALLAEVNAAKRSGALKPMAKPKRQQPSPPGHRPVLGTRDVPDPLAPGERLKATVNLAEHPLEMMLARRRLTQAEYEAGVRFRMIFERAAISPGRGIDPGKIKVDGGTGAGDPLSDSVVQAHRELAGLARVLGPIGERIMRAIAGEGLTVTDLAGRWPGGESQKLKVAYLGPRFREALDLLATEVWGARGPERGTMRGERDLGTGHVDAAAVDAANQFHLRKRGITL